MEFVYVVPRGELFPDCYPQGLLAFGAGAAQVSSADAQASTAVLTREPFERAVAEHGFFVERAHAERTPALKQPIPYAVVTVGERVLLLRRLRTGGESRLFDMLSIGVGGHVEPHDLTTGSADRSDLLLAAARRELEEELDVDGPISIEPVGILNDDSNPVGAVHVGFVLRIRVEGSVRVRERDQLEGRLATPAELRELLDGGANFETWSALLVRHMDLLPANPVGAPGHGAPSLAR
jgi:predicted NUDIX family phosphoesterase